MDWKSLSCQSDSKYSMKSKDSMPFISKYPHIVSDKYNEEFPNVSGNAKDPGDYPNTLQQEVQISDVPTCLISN